MNPIKGWLEDARKKPDVRHVDTCDGIRALAIMLVVWYHIWQQSWLYPMLDIFGISISFDPIVRSGYIWVDIMILVSGFCLYLPWARLPKGKKGQSPLEFYKRRLIRIHPSYLLTLAVMLVVALATHAYRGNWAFMRMDLLTHLTYTQMFSYQTYFSTNLGGALWTLALEMQLYFLFPLFARAFKKCPLATFAAMTGFSLAFRAFVAANFSDIGLYFNQLPAYLDTFALGMAAAAIHAALADMRHTPITRILCSLLTLLAFYLLLGVVSGQSGETTTETIRMGQMNRRFFMGLLGAVLLTASANAGWVVRHILSNPLTRFISAISLQLYIWHQTLAVWILQAKLIPSEFIHPNYEGDAVWQSRYTFACFAISILLATVLTYGFERPITKKLSRRK